MFATIVTAAFLLLTMGLGAWMTLVGIVVLLMFSRAGAITGVGVAVLGLALFVIGAIVYGRIMLA